MRYMVSYSNESVIDTLSEFGEITYKSPVINVVSLKTNYPQEIIEKIKGVTAIRREARGRLLRESPIKVI